MISVRSAKFWLRTLSSVLAMVFAPLKIGMKPKRGPLIVRGRYRSGTRIREEYDPEFPPYLSDFSLGIDGVRPFCKLRVRFWSTVSPASAKTGVRR